MTEQNVQDSVVMGDVVSHKMSSPECPSCGSQNVPIMACRNNGCDSKFCEFCNHEPWAKFVGKSDKSLPLSKFMMSSEKTSHGPYCATHGEEIIDSAKEERLEYFNQIERELNQKIVSLDLIVKEIDEELYNAANKHEYWVDRADETYKFIRVLRESGLRIYSTKKALRDFFDAKKELAIGRYILHFGWVLLLIQFIFVIPYGMTISNSAGWLAFLTLIGIPMFLISLGHGGTTFDVNGNQVTEEDNMYWSLIIPCFITINAFWCMMLADDGANLLLAATIFNMGLVLYWFFLLFFKGYVQPNKSMIELVSGMKNRVVGDLLGSVPAYEAILEELINDETKLLENFQNSTLNKIDEQFRGNPLDFAEKLSGKLSGNSESWTSKKHSLGLRRQGNNSEIMNIRREIVDRQLVMIGPEREQRIT